MARNHRPEKPARPIPLFGRDQELRSVDAAMDAAASGVGGLVALTGEPGIGKTRLAEEAVARALGRGWRVAWGSGWPDGGSPPLWPWQEILEKLGCADAARLLDGQTPTRTLDPERFARFRAVTAAIGHAAAERPVLVVLDDAHAADPAALLLARFALRSLRAAPLMLVVTFRDQPASQDEVGEAIADLVSEGTRLEVSGLDADALAGVLAWAGKGTEPARAALLLELTGGNPLLAVEVVTAASGTANVVPGRVRRLLSARLAGFDDAARAVLAAGALLGPAADDSLVATVSGATPAAVLDVRKRGLAVALLETEESTGFWFRHGLLRDALLDELSTDLLVEFHQRAADALARLPAPPTVERLTRVAYHRVAAAEQPDRLDRRAVATAVEASRAAAVAMRQRFAYESASELLRSACRLHERGGHPVPAGLLLELAQAELAGGRLNAARTVFAQAIDAADAQADSELYAEAAIGLGGMWVYEYRRGEEIARFHSILGQALTGLGDRRPDLRARLAVRVAAEAVYGRDGSVDAVRYAVAQVRKVGDQRAIAEALSLLHHSMLRPEDAHERLDLARELVEVASAAGDAVLTLMGVLWRTVDLLLLGDSAAERSLGELRERADALRVHAVLYVVEAIGVMLLIRAGRLPEAEAAASRCFELGTEVGDADATAYYGAHLLAIRWMQGRSHEVLPFARDVAASPTLVARDDVYKAAVAALAADTGEPYLEEARGELDRFASEGIDRVPSSSNFLVTFFAIVEAAARLGDAKVAAAAYDALLPYRDLPTMGSIGVVCFGSTERTLGVSARTAGRLDDSVRHFERAIEADRRLGNRPMLALARADLGLALLARGRAQDRARGVALVEECIGALVALGCDERAAHIQADADRYAAVPGAPLATLRWVDGGWEVRGGGERAVMPDSIGVRYLARLLASPRTDVEAAELAGVVINAAPHELLDAQAIAQYRRRMDQLRTELDAAEANGEVERAAVYRAEIDQLVDHVESQLGLAGRSRRFADARERARTAVQKAIRRAIHRIGETAPTLAEGLASSVRTGSVCRYEPVDDMPATWTVTGPRS